MRYMGKEAGKQLAAAARVKGEDEGPHPSSYDTVGEPPQPRDDSMGRGPEAYVNRWGQVLPSPLHSPAFSSSLPSKCTVPHCFGAVLVFLGLLLYSPFPNFTAPFFLPLRPSGMATPGVRRWPRSTPRWTTSSGSATVAGSGSLPAPAAGWTWTRCQLRWSCPRGTGCSCRAASLAAASAASASTACGRR